MLTEMLEASWCSELCVWLLLYPVHVIQMYIMATYKPIPQRSFSRLYLWCKSYGYLCIM